MDRAWLIARYHDVMGSSLALRVGSVFLGWEEDGLYISSHGRNAETSANVGEPRREQRSGYCVKGKWGPPVGVLQAPRAPGHPHI